MERRLIKQVGCVFRSVEFLGVSYENCLYGNSDFNHGWFLVVALGRIHCPVLFSAII